MFLLLKEKIMQKNDNWNFWICVFFVQVAASWRIIFFLGARFLGQVVKKGNFWTPPPKKENFDWYLKSSFFGIFVFFTFSFLVFLFFLFYWFCFWGFLLFFGPPHLALNLPYFFLFCFVYFCFFVFSGPPHLALNPPYFLFCVLVFCFLFFLCF